MENISSTLKTLSKLDERNDMLQAEQTLGKKSAVPKVKKALLGELIIRNAIAVRQTHQPANFELTAESLGTHMLDGNLGIFQAEGVCTDGMQFYFPLNTQAGVVDTLVDKLRAGRYPLDMIAHLAPLAHGGIMLDVGANVGLTSIPRMALGLFEHIHAFEPEPRNAACLRHAINTNRMSERITLWECGVGAKSGAAQITLSTNIGRHCMVAQGREIIEKYHDGSPRQTVDIKVLALDDWLEENHIAPHAVRFVKVDTEGFEPNVLAGASKLLAARHSVWQFEICPVLMQSVGSDVLALCSLMEKNFTWCMDLRNPAQGFFDTRHLHDKLAYLRSDDGEGKASDKGACYTDIVAMN